MKNFPFSLALPDLAVVTRFLHSRTTSKLSDPLLLFVVFFFCLAPTSSDERFEIMISIGTRYRNSDASRRIFLQVLTVGILLLNVSSKSAKSASRAGRLHHVTKVGTFFKNVTRLRPMRRLPVEKSGFFTNTWAVELDDPGQDEDAARIANKHGFVVLGKVIYGTLRIYNLNIIFGSTYINATFHSCMLPSLSLSRIISGWFVCVYIYI